MDTQKTLMGKNPNDLIPGTGWTWGDAIAVAREHEREVRRYPDPVDRMLVRCGEDPADYQAEEIDLDAALEHRRDADELKRLHPRRVDRIAHRHGLCSCYSS